MKKTFALLWAVALLSLEGWRSLALATPVANDDPCVTKQEAMSAVQDWDQDFSEVVFLPGQADLYKAWRKETYDTSFEGEIWALNVTWDGGQEGVIVATVNDEGCIVKDSVDKIKIDAWHIILQERST